MDQELVKELPSHGKEQLLCDITMALPELFGNYLLCDLLAESASSEIFVAQTLGDFPRLCALKRFLPRVTSHAGFGARFRKDAPELVRMVHGNVARVVDIGAADGRAYLAMDFVEGVSLMDLATTGATTAVPVECAYYVAIETIEALGYLIERKYAFHGARDPDAQQTAWSADILLSFDGAVKLIDPGGFNTHMIGQQKLSTLLKSPGYATPEVLRNTTADEKSAIFVVGIVLWELLMGKSIFADGAESYVRAVLSDSWVAPPVTRQDVGIDLIRLVAEMLSLNPAQRPAQLEQVRTPLVNALRRIAPAYGSAALSRLMARRFSGEIARNDARIKQVSQLAVAQTTPVHQTIVYGHAAATARPESLGDAALLRTGEQIPNTRYRVLQVIGRGGCADVYSAQHIDLDRRVAIKVITPQMAADPNAIANFRLEARACSRLRHQNIVDVLDFGELPDGRFFFAMELLQGPTLAEVLRTEHKLDEPRAIQIFAQLAEALDAAHAQKIVHRDVKPENIVLATDGNGETAVKLLDFGVMAFVNPANSVRSGTPGYMSPEQIRGAAPTPAMDIFAFGVCLYEALCGRLPFPPEKVVFAEAPTKTGGSTQEGTGLLLRAFNDSPKPLVDNESTRVSPELAQLVNACISLNDLQRPRSMAEIVQVLRLIQGVQSPADRTSYENSAPVSAPLTANRSHLWMATGAVIVALSVAALAAKVMRLKPESNSVPSAPPVMVPIRTASPGEKALHRPESTEDPLVVDIKRYIEKGQITGPPGQNVYDALVPLQRQQTDSPAKKKSREKISVLLKSLQSQSQTVATATDAQLAWLIFRIQTAVADGRYFEPAGENALSLLRRLKKLDPAGSRAAAIQNDLVARWQQEAQKLGNDKAMKQQADQLKALINAVDGSTAAEDSHPPNKSSRPSSKDALPWLNQARTQLHQGHLDLAERNFTKLLHAESHQAEALCGLAMVAFERAKYADAVDFAKRARRLKSNDTQTLVVLGDSLYKLLRYREALDVWKQALRHVPQHQGLKGRIKQVQDELAQ